MARHRFGPQHDITGEAVLVPEDDGAWDHDRIRKEIAESRKGTDFEKRGSAVPLARFPSDPGHRHPFNRYHVGITRYDLDAENIRDYLDENKQPEKWRLKRLSWHARGRCYRLRAEGNTTDAHALAFLEGVVGLENGDRSLAAMLEDKTRYSDTEILEKAAEVAYGVIDGAGLAVVLLSRDLSEEEKKIAT